MTCRWCGCEIVGQREDSRYCSRKCRQSAWRVRGYTNLAHRHEAEFEPLTFAYADPPYPNLARRYYHSDEVDHRSLIDRLTTDYDGWALSTSARALRDVLPLCPPKVRVCAWVKPGGAPPATNGLHNVWEPLLVLEGRRLKPGHRDALYVHPARFGGLLTGRKPLQFCTWLFESLGMLPGDWFDDLFPGTGVVTRAWKAVVRGSVDLSKKKAL